MTYADGSWNSVADLFDSVSAELEVQLQEEIEEEVSPTGGKKFSPFQTFDFSWNPTEKAYLTVIQSAANELVSEILTEPILALNDLWSQARIVQKSETGRVKRDENGNPLWQLDSTGKPLEDWTSVTNNDIEKTLVKFYEIKVDVTNRVSDLYLEAIFAKYMLKDGWNEKYSRILEGTVNEKTAAADRSVRREKYKAFSRYWLWFKANELQKDVNATIVLLEKIRSWRNWSKS